MPTDLREARHRSGLTLQQLGKLSGVDFSVISKLERGQHAPSLRVARALEAALRRKPGTIAFPKLVREVVAKRSVRPRTSVTTSSKEQVA